MIFLFVAIRRSTLMIAVTFHFDLKLNHRTERNERNPQYHDPWWPIAAIGIICDGVSIAQQSNKLLRSEFNIVGAELDERLALVQLYQAVGGGWHR
jgi:hypothetical protein